jgi:hypothetical protein
MPPKKPTVPRLPTLMEQARASRRLLKLGTGSDTTTSLKRSLRTTGSRRMSKAT